MKREANDSSTYLSAKNLGTNHVTSKLDTPELCNGTVFCVKNLCSHLIEATILTSCARGKDVLVFWYINPTRCTSHRVYLTL